MLFRSALASALTIHLRAPSSLSLHSLSKLTTCFSLLSGTHTGSKPFLCPFPGCTSAFSESSNLSKHVRTHKGEKGCGGSITYLVRYADSFAPERYGCDECGKAFSRSDQLARHKKIHTKQRG